MSTNVSCLEVLMTMFYCGLSPISTPLLLYCLMPIMRQQIQQRRSSDVRSSITSKRWCCKIRPPCLLFLLLAESWQQVTALSTTSTNNNNIDNNSRPLFSDDFYETIAQGKIGVVDNFIDASLVRDLRLDAQELYAQGQYTTDALAGYGSSGTFDASKDRAVLKLAQWKNAQLGNYPLRQQWGQIMGTVRSDLARALHRPGLVDGRAASSTLYGNGSTEISYTRFGRGAFLRKHVDEHHEECKGIAGWAQPTRRSLSWLVYLNDKSTWNPLTDGGELQCFQRAQPLVRNAQIGAMPNGDLQVGWLKATDLDPFERPVYMDGRRQRPHHQCALYIVSNKNEIEWISKPFDSHPLLYLTGGESLLANLFVNAQYRRRFQLIEAPKSKFRDWRNDEVHYAGQGRAARADEELQQIAPIGGRLVVFDSVTLPHEVLATQTQDRWATSGWFHQDQQQAAASAVVDASVAN